MIKNPKNSRRLTTSEKSQFNAGIYSLLPIYPLLGIGITIGKSLQTRGMESQATDDHANDESDESDEVDTSRNPYDRTDNYWVDRSPEYEKKEITRVTDMKNSVRGSSSKTLIEEHKDAANDKDMLGSDQEAEENLFDKEYLITEFNKLRRNKERIEVSYNEKERRVSYDVVNDETDERLSRTRSASPSDEEDKDKYHKGFEPRFGMKEDEDLGLKSYSDSEDYDPITPPFRDEQKKSEFWKRNAHSEVDSESTSESTSEPSSKRQKKDDDDEKGGPSGVSGSGGPSSEETSAENKAPAEDSAGASGSGTLRVIILFSSFFSWLEQSEFLSNVMMLDI